MLYGHGPWVQKIQTFQRCVRGHKQYIYNYICRRTYIILCYKLYYIISYYITLCYIIHTHQTNKLLIEGKLTAPHQPILATGLTAIICKKAHAIGTLHHCLAALACFPWSALNQRTPWPKRICLGWDFCMWCRQWATPTPTKSHENPFTANCIKFKLYKKNQKKAILSVRVVTDSDYLGNPG